MTMRFDDSLPALIGLLTKTHGTALVAQGVVIRDVNGRLAFVYPAEVSDKVAKDDAEGIRALLGPYARQDRVVVVKSDLGWEDLFRSKAALTLCVGESTVRLIDRRLVGADWLRSPAPKAPPPPRFVFASLKGGVGRSTALSVSASHLASRGRRVLAIDLDMEAPGLGSLLLDSTLLPKFGLIDALVENGLAPLDDSFLADLIGPSDLADRRGKIDVLPAFGKRSLENPADVLSKLARAYAEDVRLDGQVASVLDQVVELVARFSDPHRYDAILIDARAGLHETTATAILGLGAEVFLFGLDEPQTFQGYAALLSHLARFSGIANEANAEWLQTLSMVQGKAPIEAEARASFADKCRSLFIACGLETAPAPTEVEALPPAEPFSDVPWDDEVSDEAVLPSEPRAFREPAVILDDTSFRNFNPRLRRDLLSESIYRNSYGSFLARIDEFFPERTKVGNAETG